MNHLVLEQLSIRTRTNDGLYGVDIPFSTGLNIIHAENTHGKSTCIQSIIFALGLEGCLGASRKIPLKTALTTQLRKTDSSMAAIFESKIYLQITNGLETITIMRSSDPVKKDLISVFHAVKADEAILGQAAHQDYFLRVEGSATRERGFHYFLSQFLGIVQPKVLRFDGTESLLYLESMFSINYVEQTRGWGGILNVLPTYLGIKDLSSRVIEYTLNLDVQRIIKKRQELNQKKKDAERIWNVCFDNYLFLAKRNLGFVSLEFSEKISEHTNISDETYLYVDKENKCYSFKERIESLVFELSQLRMIKIDANFDIEKAKILENELNEKLIILSSQEKAINYLISDLDSSRSYIYSIESRIHGINDSLRKYKDLKRLELIGSEEEFSLNQDKCPTCHTALNDSLLSYVQNKNVKVLGLDDNIKYLEKQLDTFNSILKSELKNNKNKEMKLESAKLILNDTRELIRDIKSSLIDEQSIPSRSDIKKELIIENEIYSMEKSLRDEDELKGKFKEALKTWKLAESGLKALPDSGFSSSDWKKLKSLKSSFVYYLNEFGYSSNSLTDFQISEYTYKPTLNDVDINSEASASDNIRVIWAYLFSILTLDQYKDVEGVNHLGLLIMDEPRQQEAKDLSFRSFILNASKVKEMNKQIIIGTSERFDDLNKIVTGLNVNLRHYDSDIIKKIS